MARRSYSVAFTATAITAAQDLWEINPGDDKPIRILGFTLGQYTDVGDAASENLSVKISRGLSGGSGGTTPTAAPLDDANDTAAGVATLEMNNTTVAPTGTEVVLFSDVWNTQAGYQVWFPEGAQPHCTQASSLVVRITAPADSITCNGTLFFAEV